jgi:hypothetical protein
MNEFTIRAASLALAIVGGIAVAIGQGADAVPQAKAQELKKQDTVPPATGKSTSEKAGTHEPSAKAPTANDAAALINGALTAAGSPVDVDTVPAKFSARSAADDQLPIAGYRLKHLTGGERTEIMQGIGSQRDGTSGSAQGNNDAYAVVGAEIPSVVALQGLTAMPDALTAKFPGLRGTAFMRAGGKVLVVDLDNNLVVGVLEG